MTSSKTLMESFNDGSAWVVSADRSLKLMECMDMQTRDVFMCITPVSKDDYKSLSGLPPQFMPSGFATPSYDHCCFRTPGVYDGAVKLHKMGDFDWINVARVLESQATITNGPMAVTVGKDHVVGFDGGRTITLMELNNHLYVELVGSGKDDNILTLPEGASLKTITLNKPLAIELPVPAQAFFWMPSKTNEMRSFQGPISLPRPL